MKRGVFKGLKKSDITLSDYVSRKHWKISGSKLEDSGIQKVLAFPGKTPFYPSESSFSTQLKYAEVKHLYYSGSYHEDGFDDTCSGSVNLYKESSVTVSGSRSLPTSSYVDTVPEGSITVYNIPRSKIGTNIELNSLNIIPDTDIMMYVEDDYVQTGYLDDWHVYQIKSFEGVIAASGAIGKAEDESAITQNGKVIGDVIYSHGTAIITDPFYTYFIEKSTPEFVEWTSNVPIFTENVTCRVLDSEFNTTYNPTAKNLVGQKNFHPYITSVGLYNNRHELVAVAKLSKPVKKPDNMDLTINIRIDLT